MAGNEGLEWLLGAVSREHGIVIRWPISEDERRRLDEASRLLRWMTEGSSYADLQRRFHELLALVDDLREGFAQGEFLGQLALDEVGRSVDVVLSGLRAFEDRTKRSLSQRYGSDEKDAFTADFSAAYDELFGFRFCCRLRNYSQHCGNPVATFRATARDAPDEGREVVFEPVCDARHLADDYDGWSTVRAELEAIGGQFDLMPLVGEMMTGAAVVHAQLMMRHEASISESCGLIYDLARRVEAPGDPAVIGVPPDLTRDSTTFDLQVMPLPIELADVASNAVSESQALLHRRRRDL